MASPPTVSVVMTAFNTWRYIEQAVQSILAQSFSDLELIVIDDGSTDGTTETLRRLAGQDGRIRLRSRPNTGILKAANEGLGLARGEFIARMDSDDVSLPFRLEKQVGFLRANPEIVAVSTQYDYVDTRGRRLKTMAMPDGDAMIQSLLLRGIPGLCHSALLVRRSAIESIGGYDPAFAAATEDVDLCLRLGEVGRLANLPEVLLKVRLHGKSFGGHHSALQNQMAKLACQRAWQRRGIEGQYQYDEGPVWRPEPTVRSYHRFWLRCGWWAFNSGERKTALIYGVKATATQPLNKEAWRLLACACIKRMPAFQPKPAWER